jgi:hypothetical protein
MAPMDPRDTQTRDLQARAEAMFDLTSGPVTSYEDVGMFSEPAGNGERAARGFLPSPVSPAWTRVERDSD